MPVIAVTNTGRALLPANKAAALELEKLPRGVRLKVEPRQPRNGAQHRLFWAFASYVAEALNSGPTPVEWDQERVVTHLKLATGHVERVKLRPRDAERLGTLYAAVPKSISFAAMDGVSFSRFMDEALRYVRDVLAPWIEGSEHWPEIETILRESHLLAERTTA